ncbi:MAG: 30S ribosomal protein S17e [Candidatus Aenigmatarchaeota archaeon]|nr:MAG: 30S ribosomal protein S17e [Candidatus Aenigmarchaeota archaeon]
MGRIKTISVKTLADELVQRQSDKFTTDFSKNKETLQVIKPIKSKKIRNVLAGYITKKMKANKEQDG